MKTFLQQIWQTRDWPSLLLLAMLATVVTWVGLLPINRFVQDSYLNRFHLRTAQYPAWAAQQLTPAMYNLENTYWYSPDPLSPKRRGELSQDYFGRLEGRGQQQPPDGVRMDMLNHFPTRTITFVQSRAFLKQHGGGHFYFQSRFRDRELISSFQIVPVSDTAAKVVREVVNDE